MGHGAEWLVSKQHCEARHSVLRVDVCSTKCGCITTKRTALSSNSYAPRDEDRYITRLHQTADVTVHVDRRLSEERRLIRKLAASLNSSSDDKKQMLYDKVRIRHKKAMQRIIADISRGLVSCA
jgi:hypothetical protein